LNEPSAGQLVFAAVGLDQLRPLCALGQLDEGEQLDGVQTSLCVEVLSPFRIGPDLAHPVAASGREVRTDLGL